MICVLIASYSLTASFLSQIGISSDMSEYLSKLDLIAEHVDSLVKEAESFNDGFLRFEAFLFSPSSRIKPDQRISKIKEIYVRKALFDVSAPVDREAVVAYLLPLLEHFMEFTQKSIPELKGYIEIFEKEDWLLQVKHEKKIIAYSYNALDELQKIRASILSISSIISVLGKDPVTIPLKDAHSKLKHECGKVKVCFEDFINYISYFLGEYRLEYYLNIPPSELSQHNLFTKVRWNEMKSGDIFVSFKTTRYLKEEAVSRRIALFTGSQVTHVALFVRIPRGNMKESGDSDEYLVHSLGKGYYGLVPLCIDAGVVYIVLRPNISDDQRMRLWRVVREKVKEKVPFSTKKVIGVGITLILEWFLNLFSKRRRSIRNVFENSREGMFCSEFLNEVFRQVGFHLTPKSRHSAMVFPSDIAASPHVKFIGVAYDAAYVQEGTFNPEEAVAGVRI
jgi:hypothetical protein